MNRSGPAPSVNRACCEGESGTSNRRPDQRFPRQCRVIRSEVFRRALNESKAWAGRTLVLRTDRGDDAAGRIGIIASKRTFRRAVDRNLARRRIREAFRRERHRLRDDVDYIVIGRRRILETGPEDVEKELLWLARKAGCLRRGETG